MHQPREILDGVWEVAHGVLDPEGVDLLPRPLGLCLFPSGLLGARRDLRKLLHLEGFLRVSWILTRLP